MLCRALPCDTLGAGAHLSASRMRPASATTGVALRRPAADSAARRPAALQEHGWPAQSDHPGSGRQTAAAHGDGKLLHALPGSGSSGLLGVQTPECRLAARADCLLAASRLPAFVRRTAHWMRALLAAPPHAAHVPASCRHSACHKQLLTSSSSSSSSRGPHRQGAHHAQAPCREVLQQALGPGQGPLWWNVLAAGHCQHALMGVDNRSLRPRVQL